MLDVCLKVEVSKFVALTELEDSQEFSVRHNGTLISGVLKSVLLDVLVNHTSHLRACHL